MSRPLITATICTHNRAQWLASCLDGFAAQSADPDTFEVLIVDNASTDTTQEVFQNYSRKLPNLRYCHEPELGLSAARNAGIDAAQTDIIAYIDDDAVPYPDWIEKLLHAFTAVTPTPAAVGGEIDPVWGRPPPAWVNNPVYRQMLTAGLGWSTTAKFIEAPEWICEVNSAYTRRVLVEYGPWPTDLGRKGALLLSNENIINEKMLKAGEPIYFDPDILVKHHIHADRLTQQWFRKRIFWQGISEGIIWSAHGGSVQESSARMLKLPANSEAWLGVFSEQESVQEFQEQCLILQSIGYALARGGFLDGF